MSKINMMRKGERRNKGERRSGVREKESKLGPSYYSVRKGIHAL